MTTIKTKVEFGKKYRDKNSGFEGVCTAIAKYQHGCLRIGLQAAVNKDNEIPDLNYFDEPDLNGVKPIEKIPGGPRKAPAMKKESFI